MSGWWFSASASSPTRLTNASASRKSAKENVRSSAPSTSVHPSDSVTEAVSTIDPSVTVLGDAARLFRSSRSDVPARELLVAWIFGPAANALAALLAPLRVPPPAVVLANAAAGLAAAVAIGTEALVAAALLLQLKTLLDNADGRLARATGRATLFGRYLDTEADLVVRSEERRVGNERTPRR